MGSAALAFNEIKGVTVGGPPKRTTSLAKTVYTIGGFIVGGVGLFMGMIPGVSVISIGASHVMDRLNNGEDKELELKYRAQYYTAQIYKTLGKPLHEGHKATVSEFREAAKRNTQLQKLYEAPIKTANKKNNESLGMNAGFAAAGAILPGVELLKVGAEAGKVVKIAAGGVNALATLAPHLATGLASSKLASALSSEHPDPQALVEGIHETLANARAKGVDPKTVVTPQLIFAVRVAQDEGFGKSIAQRYGKSFTKMNAEEQAQVMSTYPALANAVTSEAYAIANDMLQVQELGASKPNLNSVANQYAVGAANSSFAAREAARRSSAAAQGGQVSV